MGEVYRARDTRLKRDVAIKVLSEDASSDSKRSKYFDQEARSASALNHPNIVTIYDIGHSDFGAYIAMELVEGKTLRDLLEDGPLPLKRMLQVAAQVADGLARAHAAGIFHRDLKPENLMITADGLVKILDFGLAKLVRPPVHGEGSQTALGTQETEPGVILGTVGYMSPEQARGLPADFRSDQFSFGAILYEMAAGKRAFQRETAVETLSAIIRDEPEHLASINAKVLPPCRWIIERCLAKNAEERYASTLDLAREIHNLRDHFPELARSDMSDQAATIPTARKRFRFVTTVGLLVAVLALLINAVWMRTPARVPTFRTLTFAQGNITGARFAADGQSVIYGAAWTGQTPQIYTTRPGNPESRSLGINNASIWSVSSSGEMAIARPCSPNWDGCTGTLALVPPDGGAPREILDNVQSADWMPDGKTLVVAQFAGQKVRIAQYPSSTVLYETLGWVRHVRVSPRGDRIAFFDHPILGQIGGSVSVLDLAGNKKVLSDGWKRLQGLAWSASGDEVWFTASRTDSSGHPNLYAVTLSATQRPVYSIPSDAWITDISRDGRVLLRRGKARAVMVGQTRGGAKERDLSWFDVSVAADLSSDGKTVLFWESGFGVNENPTVYVRGTDGSDAKRLGEGKPLALSPDGQWALALQRDAPQLMLLPTGLGKARPLPRGAIAEFLDWAAWSPDGARVFFTAAEPGHRPRTYVQDIVGGLPQPITAEGMAGTLLSSDGKRIAAVDRYQQYYLFLVEGGDPTPLEGYDDGDVLLQWSSDNRAIFLRSPGDEKVKIHRLDLQKSTKTLWKEWIPPSGTGLISVGSNPGEIRITPDGQSYVYTYWVNPGELYLAEGLK